MALTITDTTITSDEVGETGRQEDGLWYVTGYPGRAFDRNQAISAMTIAEERSRPEPNRLLIASLKSELGVAVAEPAAEGRREAERIEAAELLDRAVQAEAEA